MNIKYNIFKTKKDRSPNFVITDKKYQHEILNFGIYNVYLSLNI